MTRKNMKIMRMLKCLFLLTVLSVTLVALVAPANAQSSDPFNPTPMTTDMVKGRWTIGKHASHYYTFWAGPGVVKVSFNCIDDSGSTIVGQEMTDADGHLFTRTESVGRDDVTPTYVTGVAGAEGIRLSSTYEIKRRQKVIVRFYTSVITPESGGSYTIKVSGDGVSFNENNAPTNSTTASNTNIDKTSCLPKSGKLRLVMDDGTIQEINLSRVREITVKP